MTRQRTWLDDLKMLDSVLVCTKRPDGVENIVCAGHVCHWSNPRYISIRTTENGVMNFSKKTGKRLRSFWHLEPFDKRRWEAWMEAKIAESIAWQKELEIRSNPH